MFLFVHFHMSYKFMSHWHSELNFSTCNSGIIFVTTVPVLTISYFCVQNILYFHLY